MLVSLCGLSVGVLWLGLQLC